MKLSTKGRYGLKAMLDLAIHNKDGQVVLKSIAERQDISENYLEQLFAVLNKAKLVKGMRGSQGGYTLVKSAENITVGEIIRALEGSLAPVECVAEDYPAYCKRYDNCVTKCIWEKIRDSIYSVIDSITLESLVIKYQKTMGKDDYIYYI